METILEMKTYNFKIDIDITFEKAPLIVIFPGGGYSHLSDREALPVANKFKSLGYNVAIVYYSVAPHSNFIQLKQAQLAIKELSKRYRNIFVMGFSAGGHLAGLVATEQEKYNIKGAILCYPVISFLNHVHLGTRNNFLANGNDNEENRIKYSIDKRINKDSVPTFVWATKTDQSVPYENTMMLVEALKENQIVYKYHIFPKGPHGMALADESAIKDGDTSYVNKEVATWVNMADEFIKDILK